MLTIYTNEVFGDDVNGGQINHLDGRSGRQILATGIFWADNRIEYQITEVLPSLIQVITIGVNISCLCRFARLCDRLSIQTFEKHLKFH